MTQCEIPSISSDAERLCLATLGLYSQKYKKALQIVQDKIIEKNQSINSARPINNDHVDKGCQLSLMF